MSETAWLFDASLLSTSITDPGDNIGIRPLQLSDHAKGYDSILQQLSPETEPPLSVESFQKQFRIMAACDPKIYYVVVLVDTASPLERVVGTATLLVESKFLRSGALAGHIEDVVIATTHQGRKLGQLLICTLTELAKKIGCYKVILDCGEHNIAFYGECGYSKKGVEMKLYL